MSRPSLNEALLEVGLTIPPLLHCVCMCAHVCACVSVNTGGGVSMESEQVLYCLSNRQTVGWEEF